MSAPEIVTEQARLDELCRAWRSADLIAFDTEFIRDDTYDAALCLVQVAASGDVVLIDPMAGLSVAPFWELVCDPAITTVIHAGKEDFEVCLRSTGKPPRNIFDVQIAAGFVGLGYPLSLTRLVSAVAQKRVSKGQTLSDWTRRPLTRDQLRYAVEDVVHLPRVHELLRRQLEERGRTAWAREEFARFEDPELYRPPTEERVLKLKGSSKLDGLGLAALARLVEWRDRWAKEKNRPIRALIRDDILVEIARRRPNKPSDLEVLRGFPQARNPKIIREILDVLGEARALPKSDLPVPETPREESPMQRAVLDLLSAATRAVCHDEELSHELVGGSQRLRELLDYAGGVTREAPLLLSGWREQFIGGRLMELLAGRCEIHLAGTPREPHVRLVPHGRGATRASETHRQRPGPVPRAASEG
ncbi:MAG: HRDC domain-containing protein [Phycisphaerae bacterium]